MPLGYGGVIKTTLRHGTPQKSIVDVKVANNWLAHDLIIAIAKVDNNANYKSYRKGRKIRSVVHSLLQETGIDLTNGSGIPELNRF